jgi:hypothetical protein
MNAPNLPNWNEPIIEFEPRHVPKYLLPELSELWGTARVACGGAADRCTKLRWVAREFHAKHPDVPVLGAYKDADGMTSHPWPLI